MIASKSIALVVLLVATLVTVDAEGFFARRRNQKKQQNYQQHLMGSNFHQRFGPQGNSNNGYYSARELATSPTSSGNNRDLAAGTYGTSSAYDETAPNVYRGDHNDHHGLSGINPLSILVAPLAALALLGAAATVASNPVLLSIAVLNRKRRDVERIDSDVFGPEMETKLVEMETLEKYISSTPGENKQQEKLMATYLSCAGLTESTNFCLDRIVCDYSIQPSKMVDLEKDVISIVLFNIMSNGYIPQEFKERLRTAAQYGRSRGHCTAFVCDQLNQKKLN